jgi:heptosyltransferase III
MRRLLIRPGAIGDCILALPALEFLKSEYTEVWVPSAVVPLIQFASTVRSLASTGIDLAGVGDLEPRSELVRDLRSFDSIVSWYGTNRDEFREALNGLGLRCEFHRALPPPDYNGHAIDFFTAQVGAPAGLSPRIEIGPISSRDSIFIHPFSGSARKNWPLERFQKLASRVDRCVEWTAGPTEQLAGANRFENLAKLAAWMAGARLYIGNDSGITHLAAAIGVPMLALFGPSSPRTWGPRGENVTILDADPIDGLSVETVLGEVNRLLGSP